MKLSVSLLYDYITKLRGIEREVIPNHVNANVCGIGYGEARHRKYKRFKMAAVRITAVLLTYCSFRLVN
jgi:hypothetical protein